VNISPAGAVAINQAKIQNEVAVGMLKKSLDVDAKLGADLVKMLEQSGGLGGRVDLLA
jgi:hypothetical protein